MVDTWTRTALPSGPVAIHPNTAHACATSFPPCSAVTYSPDSLVDALPSNLEGCTSGQDAGRDGRVHTDLVIYRFRPRETSCSRTSCPAVLTNSDFRKPNEVILRQIWRGCYSSTKHSQPREPISHPQCESRRLCRQQTANRSGASGSWRRFTRPASVLCGLADTQIGEPLRKMISRAFFTAFGKGPDALGYRSNNCLASRRGEVVMAKKGENIHAATVLQEHLNYWQQR